MFSLVMYSGLHALVPSLNALFPNNTSINLVVLPWCYYRHSWCCSVVVQRVLSVLITLSSYRILKGQLMFPLLNVKY